MSRCYWLSKGQVTKPVNSLIKCKLRGEETALSKYECDSYMVQHIQHNTTQNIG